MQLRPYQIDAIDRINIGWNEWQSQLLVLPTGTGKTIVFANIAAEEVERGNRVLILAHRTELLEQAQQKMCAACGLESALEKASSRAYEGQHDLQPPNIVVASVQTLTDTRLALWNPDYFDIIIIDEAHHCLAESYQRILRHFNARILGVTATPDRGDKKTLATVFENIAYEYRMVDAIRNGHLTPIQAKLLPAIIDMDGVKTVQGDYDCNQVDKRVASVLEQCAYQIAQNIGDRKTLIFLPLIKTSERMRDLLKAHGVRAAHVDGESKDRAEILRDFANGKHQVLCNSSLLLEGYDCPEISCVVSLRPTKIRALYCQMIGRGTRIAPGKKDLLILDFIWQSSRHKLCQPATLIAKSEEQAEEIAQFFSTEKQCDIFEAEAQAENAREESLKKKLLEHQNKKARTINPIDFALSIHSVDLAEYEPISKWEFSPPSEKQLEFIAKSGIDSSMVTCKGHASRIIDTIMQRRNSGLATPKQVRLLARYGIDASLWPFEKASAKITEISKGWKK